MATQIVVEGQVTRIFGAWYDLSHFASRHPGGPVALSLAYGRDATLLFMSHHPFMEPSVLGTLLETMRLPEERQLELEKTYREQSGPRGMPTVAGVTLESLPGQEDRAFPLSPRQVFDLAAEEAELQMDKHGPSGPTVAKEAGEASGVTPPILQAAGQGSIEAGAGPGQPHPIPALDPFEADAKALVRGYFTSLGKQQGMGARQASKAPPVRLLQLAGLHVLALVFGVLPLVRGWWPALAICPTLVWLATVNIIHDAAHFALSTDWRVNAVLAYAAPWFTSPVEWYHQHGIGHHCWPNVEGGDPDLYHMPGISRFSHGLPYRAAYALQEATVLLVWLVAVPGLAVLRPFTARRSGSYNNVVPMAHMSTARFARHIAGRLLTALALYGWPWVVLARAPGPYWWAKPLAFSILPHTIFSSYFMMWSQINHHTPQTSEASHSNWYRHQVVTSHDVSPGSELAFLFSGGLSLQIEHHLFPTINHWHLRNLQQDIRALCDKHGVPYHAAPSLVEAARRLWSLLAVLARPEGEATAKKVE